MKNNELSQVNPFTLFLILILLLSSTGALAMLLKRGEDVTKSSHNTYNI